MIVDALDGLGHSCRVYPSVDSIYILSFFLRLCLLAIDNRLYQLVVGGQGKSVMSAIVERWRGSDVKNLHLYRVSVVERDNLPKGVDGLLSGFSQILLERWTGDYLLDAADLAGDGVPLFLWENHQGILRGGAGALGARAGEVKRR